MTSLRYVKSPNVTKLDGRYKLYNRGFKYRISFNTQDNYSKYFKSLKWCERIWGPEYTWADPVAWTSKRWNNNWRTMTANNKYWREIYLREEQDVTMMLLAVGG
jgi:hypothetical protein